MKLQLTPNQLRVIGCLIEKSLTTPDQYPLSLNSLASACNQKSNRDPVLSLSELEVQDAVDTLAEKQLIMNQSGNSSRVQKYKHRFCNTQFGELQFSSQELGIICVLFLRGPQTPGELRTRTSRLCDFTNVLETETVLNDMMQEKAGPYVEKFEREPGKRESRYAHCFLDCEYSNEQMPSSVEGSQKSHVQINTDLLSAPSENAMADQSSRIIALEEQVELMQMEIDELRGLIEK